MDWQPILFGALGGFLGVTAFYFLRKKLNVWVRGIIAVLIVAAIAFVIRLFMR